MARRMTIALRNSETWPLKRARILAAATFLCLSDAAAAGPTSYELRLNEIGGRTTLAISVPATGTYAIAAGAEDLHVLEDAEAKAAFDRLTRTDNPHGESAELGGAEETRKIVIHKMDYDEDIAGSEESHEVRVVQRISRSYDDDEIFAETPRMDESGSIWVEKEKDTGREGRRRFIRVFGADADEAAGFIDGARGLNAAEKAAMKNTVGL